MPSKIFRYSNLYTTSATTSAPLTNKLLPGELALSLTPGYETIYTFDGQNIIDLGSALGGLITDEKTIHKRVIPEGQPNAGKKELSSLVYLKDVTADEANLPANVKKRYRLVDANGNNVITESGDTFSAHTSDYIDVYKDSSIVEVYLGTNFDSVNASTGVIDKKQIGDVVEGHTIEAKDFEYLNYVYFAGGYSGQTVSGDGEYHMTKINLTQFLNNYEFASGLTVTAEGVARGVVDPTSEKVVTEWTNNTTSATTADVLTVGNDGFKVDNIQNAINAVRHGNLIDMSGYTPGLTEDLFAITSADTVSQAVKKIEDKLCSNGTGVAAGGGAEAGNTGIVFLEGGADIVILAAGEY